MEVDAEVPRLETWRNMSLDQLVDLLANRPKECGRLLDNLASDVNSVYSQTEAVMYTIGFMRALAFLDDEEKRRFILKEVYATESEARKGLEPFGKISNWLGPYRKR